MKALVVGLLLSAALGASLRADPPEQPALTSDAAQPLFDLKGLRHGDRAERCVTVTNKGGENAHVTVLGEHEGGDLAEHLALVVTRGCREGVVLFSGRMADFASVGDPLPLPGGAPREFGLAVEVAGADAQVAGRRAVEAFAWRADGAAAAPGGVAGGAASQGCATVTLSGRRNRRLIKRHRVSRRVVAKLIIRVYGLFGQQRLVLVTGLRVGRRVLPGRAYGRVTYRVGDGAAVTSRRRPFRVRIAPSALRPGRNLLHVMVAPRHGRAVRARFVLRLRGAGAGCVLG